MFSGGGVGSFAGAAVGTGAMAASQSKDLEVVSPPSDGVSQLAFSPSTALSAGTFLIGSSWDMQVRCWQVQNTGQTILQAQQSHQAPVLGCCWHSDGTKVFTASCDRTSKVWDLQQNAVVAVAQHDAPIKTVHWIKAQNYECLMTGSWDKTLKFWDLRSPQPLLTLQLHDRVYCADVMYPLAVVCTGNSGISLYNLENQPAHVRNVDSMLKYQHRAVCIFPDKKNAQQPGGFAVGSIEGRVAIQYLNPSNPKQDFTFKCHRQPDATGQSHDIYAINDIKLHPQHGTLVTVGSDGQFNFWDKDLRVRLKASDKQSQSISACALSPRGDIFAYSVCYDWSKGHEFNNPQLGTHIYLRPVAEEMKRKNQKRP